jgi:hypothetical protein
MYRKKVIRRFDVGSGEEKDERVPNPEPVDFTLQNPADSDQSHFTI